MDLHNDDLLPVATTVRKRDLLPRKLKACLADGHWILQCLSLWIGAFLTHLYSNDGKKVGGNLAQATLVTLCCHLAPQLSAPFAMGAYIGVVSDEILPGNQWLCLLCLVGTCFWRLMSHFKLLVGFSGRLGFAAFVSCHITQVAILIPADVVHYQKGSLLSDVLFFGKAQVWDPTPRWQPIFTGLVAATYGAVQSKFLRDLGGSLENPITAATSGALLCFIVLTVTGWSYAEVAMNGIAVGSFVGMASLELLPTTWSFALVGLLAGCFIPLLEPVWQGWSGKQGTCAFLGCCVFLAARRLCRWIRSWCRPASKDQQNV
ncbi:unnamed protein product [Polarella glacialis]|uniref:Uncharacterized protein n=1 Tax=Polarella glacialis TaxID=89957 RepID=A0A813DVB2_POLGL|nr:unnamed protein product [Polarella glacialis]